MIEITLRCVVQTVGERTEICEELDIGGSDLLPVTDGSKNRLSLRGSGCTVGNGGVHIGELAPAHLRRNPFRLCVVVLGVALRGDDEVRGSIQSGADKRLRVSHVSARNLDRAICRVWSHHFSTEQKYKIICSI